MSYRCPECGKEIVSLEAKSCPECGYPIDSEALKNQLNPQTSDRNEGSAAPGVLQEASKNKVDKKDISKVLFVFAAVMYLMCLIMIYKGYDKMTNYYNSENYYSLNKNAYVGGDAYNYIINGTYATGFFALSSGFMVTGSVFTVGGLYFKKNNSME